MSNIQVEMPPPSLLGEKDKRGYTGVKVGVLLGFMVGALTGAIAGLPGVVAGALIGAIVGSLAGLANDRYWAQQSSTEHRIEDIEAEAEREIELRRSRPPAPRAPEAGWMDRVENSLRRPIPAAR